VLDIASGSGIVAIAAALAGAAEVAANDIDPMCEAAISLNAELNGVAIRYIAGSLLEGEPPPFDVIVAADVFYEQRPAQMFRAFLERAHAAGITCSQAIRAARIFRATPSGRWRSIRFRPRPRSRTIRSSRRGSGRSDDQDSNKRTPQTSTYR
jgi:2-polyprenyl-3-methyl-5-hydroxy-6-metoxy-1,4-benzoquinol methylase